MDLSALSSVWHSWWTSGWPEVVARSVPADAAPLLLALRVWLVLAVGVAFVLVPPMWQLVRIGVTLVHELGHAAVGIAVGRRFTGFVIRADMSGHAVTVGPARGAGLLATTWAGYPAPAIVGALLVVAASRGWAAPVITATCLAVAAASTRARSWTTAGVVLVVLAGAVALWWWRDDALQAQVVLGLAVVLILGAWRHVLAVAGAPRGSDPAELARRSRMPAWFWVGTHLIAIGGATWLAARIIAGMVAG